MIIREINNFTFGVVNKLEKESIPLGSAARALNYVTKGDQTELRRGHAPLGVDPEDTLESKGVWKMERADGVQVLIRKRGRKLEYYDRTTELWVESGTDLFPVEAEEDKMTASNYQSLAGAQTFISTPNSSIYKIMPSNPGSPVDLESTTFRGNIKIYKSRMFLWNRRGAEFQKDLNGLYLSWIDNQKYTTETAENIGTGDGSTDTFNDTLAFKAGGSKRTCFGIVVKVDGVVTFADDFNGNLVHVDGASFGSGTINYATGDISVTLTTPPAAPLAITVDYQWEDSSDEGVADFSFSAPRVAGEGDILRQDEGGPIQNLHIYADEYYVIHTRKTYRVVLSIDDTDAENNVFRESAGIASPTGSCSTGEGIYYIDTATEESPTLRLFTLDSLGTSIIPIALSSQLDLTRYEFDLAWIEEQGDLIHIGCRTSDSEVNNRVITYNKVFKSWDFSDFFSSCGTVFEGSLIIGDSLSGNVSVALSGFDDDEAAITGYWESNQWDLDYPSYLKKSKRLVIEGLISRTQIHDVFFAPDEGDYVLIGQIRGDADYVDAQSVSIGSETIGKTEIAGGGPALGAYHYVREFPWRSDRFEKGQIKIAPGVDVATGEEGIGYFSFSKIQFRDVRIKSQKLPMKYRS